MGSSNFTLHWNLPSDTHTGDASSAELLERHFGAWIIKPVVGTYELCHNRNKISGKILDLDSTKHLFSFKNINNLLTSYVKVIT